MSLLVQVAHHFEAGEELDTLVALHVMGWVMISREARHDTWSRPGSPEQLREGVIKISEWHPSRDLVQALQVLNACGDGLTQDGNGFTWGTAIRRTGHAHWEISLSEDMMGTTKAVWAPTLELAICRAAVALALRKEIREETAENLQERLVRGARQQLNVGLPQNHQPQAPLEP